LGSGALPRALAFDHTTADVSAEDRVMLDFAEKLTLSPASVTADDAARLSSVGFDDTGVLDVVQVVSYYNYVNRLADGLGVELESYWTDEELTMTRAEFEAYHARRQAREDR